ncbi:MAG: prepilin-type N-terminal cleavage/methylation domain-containing protein [Desulfovibrionales bacterium]
MAGNARKSVTPVSGIQKLLGLTLIELLIVVAIIGTLATIAIPIYQEHQYQTQIDLAKMDIILLEQKIDRYRIERNKYPASLADIGEGGRRDPWDNPYRYMNIANHPNPGFGGMRKDRSLVPLNTDYDLYSMGRDGRSNQSLRPKQSHDDIIRANDGAYLGLAEDY